MATLGALVPIHLHPTADLAERVLLPGDPGRALRLAQELIDGPKMFNHHRGLWGYTGPALTDGAPLTIQATGMGGPSAAIVVSELIELGARRLVRIGTCGALDPTLALGELLLVTEAIADDGASRALGATGRVGACGELTERLGRAGGQLATGPVVATDLFYDARDREAGWIAAGARAVEMETATVFRLAERHGVQAAAVLIVTDLVAGERIGEDALHEAELHLGRAAVAALSA